MCIKTSINPERIITGFMQGLFCICFICLSRSQKLLSFNIMMLRLSILRLIFIILSRLFDSDFDNESDKNLTKVLISNCVTLCLIFNLFYVYGSLFHFYHSLWQNDTPVSFCSGCRAAVLRAVEHSETKPLCEARGAVRAFSKERQRRRKSG